MSRESSRLRKIERAQALLRRVDLEEVLEALGLDVIYFKGADAYTECPDPAHYDENPSFHVCVEDVEDLDGNDRLGAFNCWSHGEDGFSGANFLDLVARILGGIWGDDVDGNPRFSREADRDTAAVWIRRNFLGEIDFERLASRRRRTKKRAKLSKLTFPPSRPVADADPRFQVYLSRRGITLERASELGVVGVHHPGSIGRLLSDTCPAVLFPIHWDGKTVNWFARSISRHCPKAAKGRYAPVKLAKLGILWAPDKVELAAPTVLVEGIFDAERVRRVLAAHSLCAPYTNVQAVLGGRLTPEQSRRLRAHETVVHLADGDEGGKTLSESIRKHLDLHTSVVVRKLPEGTDPDDAPEGAVLESLRPVVPVHSKITRRVRRR